MWSVVFSVLEENLGQIFWILEISIAMFVDKRVCCSLAYCEVLSHNPCTGPCICICTVRYVYWYI